MRAGGNVCVGDGGCRQDSTIAPRDRKRLYVHHPGLPLAEKALQKRAVLLHRIAILGIVCRLVLERPRRVLVLGQGQVMPLGPPRVYGPLGGRCRLQRLLLRGS